MITLDRVKFLAILGLPNDNTLTPAMVAEALASLSEEELRALEKEIVIVTPNPYENDAMTAKIFADISKCTEYVPCKYTEYVPCKYDEQCLTDVEIKRKLKYEKNYMAASAMRRQLGPRDFKRGKHAKGKRYVKR